MIDWGIPGREFFQLLRPEFFLTPGCEGCNRPYYNERPGGEMFNYPRPLTREEFYQACRDTVKNTAQEEGVDEKLRLASFN